MQLRKTSSRKTSKIDSEGVTAAETMAASESTTKPRVIVSSKSKSKEKNKTSVKQQKVLAVPATGDVMQVVSGSSSAETRLVEKAMAVAAGAASYSSYEVLERTPDSQHENIAKLAHSYWVARGCRDGSPEDDWYRAEQEIGTRLAR